MLLPLSEYWDLGHKLFKTTPQSSPVPFVAGDAFDAAHLEIVPPLPTAEAATLTTSASPLLGLTSLNPLRGHVSAIHASSFFHLFGEAEQLHLARALAVGRRYDRGVCLHAARTRHVPP